MRRFEIRLSKAAERALPGRIRHQGQGIIGKRACFIEQSSDSLEPVAATTMRQRPIRDTALRSRRTKPSQP
jgi:hypothetical protein